MHSPPFQNRVAAFVNQHHLEISANDRMLDLTSEIGELAKEILIASDYGRGDFQPSESWNDELGDVFFSLICLANSANANLLDALENALNKYQARFESGGDIGSLVKTK